MIVKLLIYHKLTTMTLCDLVNMKKRDQVYMTNTIMDHHRIVHEGNRFKKDIDKINKWISKFVLEVSVSHRHCNTKKVRKKETKEKNGKQLKSKSEATSVASSNEDKKTEKRKRESQKKAKDRLSKIKRGSRKAMSRSETDYALKDALMRLSDWSQRAYKIMDNQLKDITKLYIATMDYNSHLNTSYVVPLGTY